MQIYRFCKHIIPFPLEASGASLSVSCQESTAQFTLATPLNLCCPPTGARSGYHRSFPVCISVTIFCSHRYALYSGKLSNKPLQPFDTDAQWYIAVARSPNVLGNLVPHVPGIAHCRVETPNERVFNTRPVTLTQRQVTGCHEICTRCRCSGVFSQHATTTATHRVSYLIRS